MVMILVPSWFAYMASASLVILIVLALVRLAARKGARRDSAYPDEGLRQQLSVLMDSQQQEHKHMRERLDSLKSKLDFWTK